MSDIVQKLLECVDDMKDKHSFTDNDYLTACNVLKNSYEIIKLKENPEIKDIKDLNITVYGKLDNKDDECWKLLHIKHLYKINSSITISYKFAQTENTMTLADCRTMLMFIVSQIILECKVFIVEFNNVKCIYDFENFYEKMESESYDEYLENSIERRRQLFDGWKKYLMEVINSLICDSFYVQ